MQRGGEEGLMGGKGSSIKMYEKLVRGGNYMKKTGGNNTDAW